MARIHVSGGCVSVVLEGSEMCSIGFKPDGADAHSGSLCMSISVGMVHLPGARAALSVHFPRGRAYQTDSGSFVLLDDPNGADELVFHLDRGTLRLRRYDSGLPEE